MHSYIWHSLAYPQLIQYNYLASSLLPPQIMNNNYEVLNQKYQKLRDENHQLKYAYEAEKNKEKVKRLQKRKKIKRRSENQLQKSYSCPYDQCKKQYASSLALNLHIKKKHNGGNLSDRDKAAKIILKAELMGKIPPQISINLPPNYIENNKIRLMLMESQAQLSQDISESIKQE